jgi:hypothetical protein
MDGANADHVAHLPSTRGEQLKRPWRSVITPIPLVVREELSMMAHYTAITETNL